MLPRTFVMDVAPPVRTHAGARESDVASLDALINAQVEATNTMVLACSALQPPDVTAWGGVYQAWQALHNDWLAFKVQQDRISWIDVPGILAAQAVDAQYIDKMNAGVSGQSFLVWTRVYQTKVTAMCPGILPPVQPPTPGQPPKPTASWLCSTFGIGCSNGAPPAPTDTWPTAIKWIAIAAIVGVALFYVGPAVAAAAGLAAAKMRERKPSGSGASYSFGDMTVEAPSIEGLQFGDVGRDEVLALIGSAGEQGTGGV